MESRLLESQGPEAPPPAGQDFSLVLGGPLFQILRRAHLAGDALTLLRQRVITLSLLAWLPLLLLSALAGQALGGAAAVPFLMDVEVHTRFLAAMPLLIAAELVVHRRIGSVVKVFRERRLVPESAVARFDACVASALRLRNSAAAEALMIALVYALGVLVVWRRHLALDAATWYAVPSAGGSRLSLAGVWYGFVSLPLFQFLLCRWYFRLFIWFRFLWQVSRINLRLLPAHPDRVGGLGFLSDTTYAFALLSWAHGALLAGLIADRIFFLGAALPEFKVEISVMATFVLGLVIGPLLVFAPQLARTKRASLLEFGALGARTARWFDAKWLKGGASAGEPLLEGSDVLSLSGLGVLYESVRTMRLAPVTRAAVLQIAAATLAPVAPLVLTMMPLKELAKTLTGVLF